MTARILNRQILSGQNIRHNRAAWFSRSLFLRAGLTFVSYGAFMAGMTDRAQAEMLKAHYALSIAGLSIGSAYASATLAPASYKIDIGVKLSGLAAMISSAKGAASATGAIANGAALPATYANTTANSTETRTVRMALNAGTVRAVDISPPFLDMEGRLPVTDAHKSHVLDPVGALVMGIPAGESLVGPAACNRTLPVYDGLMRFNIVLTYTGVREVQSKGYSGPVTTCSARYVPISGFKPDSQSTQYMADNRALEVWLAPVEPARIVIPFYISVGTKAGTLVIQAKDFSLTGAPQ